MMSRRMLGAPRAFWAGLLSMVAAVSEAAPQPTTETPPIISLAATPDSVAIGGSIIPARRPTRSAVRHPVPGTAESRRRYVRNWPSHDHPNLCSAMCRSGRNEFGQHNRAGKLSTECSDADSHGITAERDQWREFDIDVEHYERHELCGIRCVERCEGNLRYPEYRCAHCQFELHVGVCRKRRHRDPNGYRDGDRRDTVREPVSESAGGSAQHQLDAIVDQRQRHQLRRVGWLVGYQGDQRLGERWPDYAGHHLYTQL